MDLFATLEQNVKGQGVSIVFPEGTEPRILGAVARLQSQGILNAVVLGNPDDIQRVAADNGFDITGVTIRNPEDDPEHDQLAAAFMERRHGKATAEQAAEAVRDATYFGTMLVYTGAVDGLVSGTVHSTANTVRPALQIIKTKPGVSRTSGAFIMQRGDERYLFADTAINIDPSADELAEIAVESAGTAKAFGIDPKVAMLSFSTKGSAAGDMVTKVQEATAKAQALAPDVPIDGELQFDAAFVPSVGAQKAPDSTVAGHATVFVFPELQSGNIGYKIAQRLGGFQAVGPILQGLNQPVSDLSRGASTEDVYQTALVTATQVLASKND
ncbi:phosphate acetyltransferase [Lacticaseibacillus pantheris]|uniref:Phosphate acetyltransferase n=1 Tax=Lacticaseibacillus pantheris DSM 15945 = JCM 12539 = NBRC 106106 TaxID=1423783 RepID=A0A0R1U4G0_9LACO|nr:phosphate acetyltransferase [Lacticaseibacillus pantheris]KRL86346.1 phosphotransacetylase [Lacticaseibacillus pantheris DSM 15945 = JCM 12539 = NBRC 106106]WKF85727.1 phosphate acetyltransferase [Lacticaseibacillus pantheris]